MVPILRESDQVRFDAGGAEPFEPSGLLRGDAAAGGLEFDGDRSSTADREDVGPTAAERG